MAETEGNPIRIRPLFRVIAAVLILGFLAVVVDTTVRSVGGYCLTSDGGNTARLPSE